MAHANEVAETWLYARLTADPVIAAAGVYSEVPPEGTALPYVIFQAQFQGADMSVVGGTRLWTDQLYHVKVVIEGGSYAPASDLAARIDTQLHKQSGAAAGGRVVSCIREQTVSFPTREHGVEYRHRGGTYRLQVQEN